MSDEATNGCSIQEYRWCPGMERCLQSEPNVKGLSLLTTFNLRTGTIMRSGVVYKTTARDPGVVLNTCPWCQADLRFVEVGDHA